ncbi:hypothetical protein J6590_074428 [Homalodisca vitripennis]|nr:hypothetical protein J6590_074428 [Homalodisca vitripennis]
MVNAKIIYELRNLVNPVLNQNLPAVGLGPFGSSPPYQTITVLQKSYWLLYDATNGTPIFYSDQMTAVIFTLIVQMTTILFYFFQRVVKHDIPFIVALTYFLVIVLIFDSSTYVTGSRHAMTLRLQKELDVSKSSPKIFHSSPTYAVLSFIVFQLQGCRVSKPFCL